MAASMLTGQALFLNTPSNPGDAWSYGIDVLIPLIAAVLLGGLVGFERETQGQWAGLRTHMMVSLAAAIYTIAGLSTAAQSPGELSRVIQGIAAGIGFIGAGTIIKLTDRLEIRGLTTASSLWLAAAIGVAVAIKLYVLAVSGAILSLIVLNLVRRAEAYLLRRANKRKDTGQETDESSRPAEQPKKEKE